MIPVLVLIFTIIVLVVSSAVVFIPWRMITGNAAKGDRYGWPLPMLSILGGVS
jgi:hypothetical protein